MSDAHIISTDTSHLFQRLQNAEKSIQFIQREHAETLASLHEEIAQWQQKCCDLTFQLAINSTVNISQDDNKFRKTIEELENDLHQCKTTITNLNKSLEEKEDMAKDFSKRLVAAERKHALKLHAEYDKQKELKKELKQRSILITQLTSQLQREKQHQLDLSNRIHLGQIILPNKPRRLKNSDGQQQNAPTSRYLTKPSSLISNQHSSYEELSKVLFIGRRPLTPPKQSGLCKNIEANHEHIHKKCQRSLLNSHSENAASNEVTSLQETFKVSTVLPPIVNRKLPLKALATVAIQREAEV